MRAYIDREGCIACGLCANTCPEVFRMADDGLAEVFADEIPTTAQTSAVDARKGCPVAVINIRA